MKCDDPREVLIEYLYEELDDDQRIAIDRHLETCAPCRSEAETLRRTMQALNGWEPIDAPVDERAIRRAIGAGFASSRILKSRRYRRVAGLLTGAAAAVVTFSSLAYFQTSVVRHDGTLAIYFGTDAEEVVRPSPIEAATREFMLLLLQGNDAATESSPNEENDRVAQYRAWAGGIASAGYPIQGQKLTQQRHRLILGDNGEVSTLTDATGTGDDTAELVTGYFRIGAPSLEEALAVAQSCPHLTHGGRIELREVDPRTRR